MSQKQVANLLQDHRDIEAGQPSPYLTDMERFYFQKPDNFRGKIMMARWIPESVRAHMIQHVRAMLIAASKGKRRIRRIAFGAFVKDPVIKKAQTPRFNFGKHKDGSVWKQDRRNGRFVRFSKKEREAISGAKTTK